jgi:uncharacterized membrane protein
MSINLTLVALYVINIWLRWSDPSDVLGAPLWLSVIGVGGLIVSGWLGGKMVYVQGVAVDVAPDTTTPLRK